MPPKPSRIHVVYACEDRPAVRELIRACRARGVDATWDRDWDPWDEEHHRGDAPIKNADAVVVYGPSADHFKLKAFKKASDLNKPIVVLHAGDGVGPYGHPARGVSIRDGSPVDALIEHLGLQIDPDIAAARPRGQDGTIGELLDAALRANLGVPTDAMTERLFLNERAAQLTERAFAASNKPEAIRDDDFYRARLEYARLLRFRGAWGDAATLLDMSWQGARRAQDLGDELRDLLRLERGALKFERGLIDEGIEEVEEVVEHFEGTREIGPNLIKSLRQLGNMAVEQGDWARTDELLSSAMHLARVLDGRSIRLAQARGAEPDDSSGGTGATMLWLDCLRELASFRLRQERVGESLELFYKALDESASLKEPAQHLIGVLHYHIGRAHWLHTGRLRDAHECLLRSQDILERYDNPVRVAFVYDHLARVRSKLPPENHEIAISAYFERALRIRESCGHVYMTANTLVGRGDYHVATGALQQALDDYGQALTICGDHGKTPEEARAAYLLGMTQARDGRVHEAKSNLLHAEELFRKLELGGPLREVEYELLKLEARIGDDASIEDLIALGQAEGYEFCANEVGEYAVHRFIQKLVEGDETDNAGEPRRWGRGDARAMVPIGIGDDAATIRIPGAEEFDVVLTTDAAPGSICRSREVEKGEYAAQFSVIHSLSDVLAMGATPIAVLLNLYLERDAKLEYVTRVIKTVRKYAHDYGATLIGGDVKERREQSVGCVGVGLVRRGGAIRRSGAIVDDVVAITRAAMDPGGGGPRVPRPIGTRWAQEVLEKRGLQTEPEFVEFCARDWKRDLLFLPYEQMLTAAATGRVTSAIDTSDGVLGCLQLLGKQSNVAFRIEEERVNEVIDPRIEPIAKRMRIPRAQFLFNAGHDWEVVLTVHADHFEKVRDEVRETGGDLAPLGKAIPRSDELDGGIEYVLADGGRRVKVPFFTDEKFVRRPYEDRPLEWDDLKFYLEGGYPL